MPASAGCAAEGTQREEPRCQGSTRRGAGGGCQRRLGCGPFAVPRDEITGWNCSSWGQDFTPCRGASPKQQEAPWRRERKSLGRGGTVGAWGGGSQLGAPMGAGDGHSPQPHMLTDRPPARELAAASRRGQSTGLCIEQKQRATCQLFSQSIFH